jgi:ATP-dependent DNA ligase
VLPRPGISKAMDLNWVAFQAGVGPSGPAPLMLLTTGSHRSSVRYHQHDGHVFLYAFDLIESNGDDLRR